MRKCSLPDDEHLVMKEDIRKCDRCKMSVCDRCQEKFGLPSWTRKMKCMFCSYYNAAWCIPTFYSLRSKMKLFESLNKKEEDRSEEEQELAQLLNERDLLLYEEEEFNSL